MNSSRYNPSQVNSSRYNSAKTSREVSRRTSFDVFGLSRRRLLETTSLLAQNGADPPAPAPPPGENKQSAGNSKSSTAESSRRTSVFKHALAVTREEGGQGTTSPDEREHGGARNLPGVVGRNGKIFSKFGNVQQTAVGAQQQTTGNSPLSSTGGAMNSAQSSRYRTPRRKADVVRERKIIEMQNRQEETSRRLSARWAPPKEHPGAQSWRRRAAAREAREAAKYEAEKTGGSPFLIEANIFVAPAKTFLLTPLFAGDVM